MQPQRILPASTVPSGVRHEYGTLNIEFPDLCFNNNYPSFTQLVTPTVRTNGALYEIGQGISSLILF